MRREPDELTRQLQRWGFHTIQRYAPAANDDGARDHPLDRAREFAPGTRAKAAQRLAGRDGRSRRRIMAACGGMEGQAIVPMWATDPVPCIATHGRGGGCSPARAAVDVGVPDDLMWIDRALSSMERQAPLRALILRTEFTVAVSQAVKARMVHERYGGALSVRQYRYELAKALDWLRGRQAA